MLIPAAGPARAALVLQAQRLATSAHNTANLSTEGFVASQVVANELAGGGVRGALAPTGDPAPLVVRGGEAVALSNTDVTREAVTRSLALRAYQANAAVVRADDDLAREVLDLKA